MSTPLLKKDNLCDRIYAYTACLSDSYLVWKKYKVGSTYDRAFIEKLRRLTSILCNNPSCLTEYEYQEISELIRKELA